MSGRLTLLGLRRRRRDQSGYAALFVALMATVLFALAAFSVDVGRWYLAGHQMQRAADAGALAGVVKLPGDPTGAFTTAKDFAKRNGFDDAAASTAVVTAVDGQPTRLRVTVTDTVQNVFGSLLGLPETTITRTAVADYAGPVAMGSPCNTFGNDPVPASARASACDGVNGQFWANVAGPASTKVSGDQFQAGVCASGVDGCSGTTNTDYDPNGYFYTLHVAKPVSNLKIELFDPALIDVGDLCDNSFIKGGSPAVTTADNTFHTGTTETTVYAPDAGTAQKYCTGDIRFGGTGQVKTRFQVRSPSATPWDPTSFPLLANCTKTYDGFSGNLFPVLDQYTSGTTPRGTYNPTIAENFRRWVTLCTIPSVPAGDYLIQVNTNGLGADAASGHNRFAMRASSLTNDPFVKENVSIAARGRMAIYANMTGSRTEFYLARVPNGSAGQVLNVTLFDAGDSSTSGTITLKAPPDSGVTFTNCKSQGVVNSNLPTCTITANSSFNGKKQVISVVIPNGYSCQDLVTTACWVRLEYNYGSGSVPTDTTSWQANIEGDPVRLVE